jgi:hypothetical protein
VNGNWLPGEPLAAAAAPESGPVPVPELADAENLRATVDRPTAPARRTALLT